MSLGRQNFLDMAVLVSSLLALLLPQSLCLLAKCRSMQTRSCLPGRQAVIKWHEYLCKLALRADLLLQGTGSSRQLTTVHLAMPARM